MNEPTLKYFIYARKSSESDDKQVQSIDDQVATLREIAARSSLRVIDVITEAKSAKEPGRRAQFERMMERIEKGEAKGILTWKADRLSRNPIDSARLQWLLQKEILLSIRTPDREYCPEDNALLLGVESSMANQYIRDLSKNVKRGQKSKLEKGWRPGIAPLGYMNTKTEIRGENYILTDPLYFPILRKAWDLMLTGAYVPDEILDRLNNEWGFRTRVMKRRGSKPMARSTIYRMFTNVFYAGLFEYSGQLYQGKHEPMVSLEEYDKVQILLGREGKRRPDRHQYAYNGIPKCGECGGFISATFKEKVLKSTNEHKIYTLYYCTNKKQCPQAYTNAELIDAQIEKEVLDLELMPEFLELALEILEENEGQNVEEHKRVLQARQEAVEATKKQLANLTALRLQDLIEDEEFKQERTRLKNEIVCLEKHVEEAQASASEWVDLTAETFRFATYAYTKFTKGDLNLRREILLKLGWNHTLKDGILSFEAFPWLIPISETANALNVELRALELQNTDVFTRRKVVSEHFRPIVRSRRDLNPQPPT
jgi:site-specific DNA recombinase